MTAAEYVLEGGKYVDKPLNLTVTGKHTLRYTAKDQLGNVSYALQTVFVRSSDGMFVTANGLPLSDTESETAIVNTGVITFNVSNFRTVGSVGGTKLENELGTYDVYYFRAGAGRTVEVHRDQSNLQGTGQQGLQSNTAQSGMVYHRGAESGAGNASTPLLVNRAN